ncbi:hypothetical protein [Catenuloplanes atrovinosus]|uniref:Uncharacterized protein n=1 Tax=Catenuloplanes atrovinosus TaxID=137266 RepID=A0AAE3YRM5_9ACTN|nr:hypothetical protein [Catenuloplanes atrovinosus]MDR7277396.1 hypothetical protein [Catenuloplanes atrovinosus]
MTHPLAAWWTAHAAALAPERRVLREYAATLTFTIGWWHWLSSAKPILRDRLTLRIDDHVTALRTLCGPAVPLDDRLAAVDHAAGLFLDTADTITLGQEEVMRMRDPLRHALDVLDEIELELLRPPG